MIPFHRPSIGQQEIDAVVECMRSGWLTTGSVATQFEKQFAEFVGAKHAIAVNSATAGLHLALEALGLGAKQKVITTPYTFTASAEVIRYFDADPLFVDIDDDTLNISVDNVEHALQSNKDIAAIMPVHIAGQSCNMTSLKHVASNFDVPIVEDAAHALPTTHAGQLVGSIGDVSVFSFYVTKTLATGEGGMITTDDADIAARLRIMRLHGIDRNVFDRYTSDKPAWYYEIVAPGFKYNLTDMAAAIGVEQLKKVWAFHERREEIAQAYNAAFDDLPVVCPKPVNPDDTHSWHLYILRLRLEDLTITRNELITALSEHGVGTSVHFIPLHLQPYWRDRYNLRPEDFPVADDVYQRAISLPIYPGLTDSQVRIVIDAVRKIINQNTK